jgi:hypothetical protein
MIVVLSASSTFAAAAAADSAVAAVAGVDGGCGVGGGGGGGDGVVRVQNAPHRWSHTIKSFWGDFGRKTGLRQVPLMKRRQYKSIDERK